jgi:3-dehydroquinate dehydratase-2
MKIIIINGPNLNLLGKREPEIYGSVVFEEYLAILKKDYPNVQLDYFQSNVEGLLIDKLQETGFDYDGIVLNAGGYTHTSIAIADAIAAIITPVIEVHISNPMAREEYRHQSFMSSRCVGTISGLGLQGYRYAVDFFANKDIK